MLQKGAVAGGGRPGYESRYLKGLLAGSSMVLVNKKPPELRVRTGKEVLES